MDLLVNGKRSTPAPITIVVAPYQKVPNLPPGYVEVSRWTDGTKTTTIRCWPEDRTATRMEERDYPVENDDDDFATEAKREADYEEEE